MQARKRMYIRPYSKSIYIQTIRILCPHLLSLSRQTMILLMEEYHVMTLCQTPRSDWFGACYVIEIMHPDWIDIAAVAVFVVVDLSKICMMKKV